MKCNWKKSVTVIVSFAMCIAVWAQTNVNGIVVDSNDDPLIGASVMVKDAQTGVVTDIDGIFSIQVPKGKNTLVVSYIGYVTREVKIGKGEQLHIVLEENSELLDEVVVVGYGTMKKSDVAASSVSLGEEALKGSVIQNLDQSLQGRVAGVQAVANTGAPGSSSSIRVRGQATINSNAEPLYVIDGVIMQGGGQSGQDFGLGDKLGNGSVSTVSPLSTINPADIVSMEILKDASATAIYGAQGANGVVLITTKRGKKGNAKISYDGMFAVQRQGKRLDMMNLREYASYYQDFVNTGQITSPDPSYSDPSLLGAGTNWQDAIFRTALQHSHQIGISGGSDNVQYYFSGNYSNQEGTIIGSDFERYSFRVNLDAQLLPWLKFGLGASFGNTGERLLKADQENGVINYSLLTLPDIPIYNIDGSYATISREGYTNPNPVALALMDDIELSRQKLNGNIFFDIKPFKKIDITWHAELDYDFSWTQSETFRPTVDLGGWVRDINESTLYRGRSRFWAVKNYITWNHRFDRHSISAMLGQDLWESYWEQTGLENTNLPSNEVHNPALGTGTIAGKVQYNSSSMASFFARANYNYDDRYLSTYTYRYDGSSNFGPSNRWAGFHSIALAWRLSQEKFMEPASDWLSDAKIRLGWGQTGNSNIGGYRWGTSVGPVPTGLGLGYRPLNLPNSNVKWESQTQWNLGLDLALFHNRLQFTAEFYLKRSDDMLMTLQLPTYMGTLTNESSRLEAPAGNYGSIENRGMEFSAKGHIIQNKDFEWTSELSVSVNRNKLLSLEGTDAAQIVGYGQYSDVVSVSNIGESLFSFYGYVCDGVYKDFNDIQNSPKPAKYPFVRDAGGNIMYNPDGTVMKQTDLSKFNPNTTVYVGDLKFKDLNGDGIIDENDRTNIGSPMPKFTFGWTNSFRYRDFDLSLFLTGSVGNKVMNYMSINMSNMSSVWRNQLSDVCNHAHLEPISGAAGTSWIGDISDVRVSNPSTNIPRVTYADPNDNDRISDRYVEDGSYLRVKNITLGYTLPSALTKKWKIENIRIYSNIQNLLTFTKYKGYDPEIGAGNQYVMGLDNGRYPSPVTYSFGLNLTF